MTLASYESALNWLGRGWHVLPIQPNTKKQVAGFGLRQSRITAPQEARAFFLESRARYNLAVIAPDDCFILDFDEWDVWTSWVSYVKALDPRLSQTYTEVTPNDGTHVFLQGRAPQGISLSPGVELKRVALVAPSSIDGITYDVLLDYPISAGSLEVCFFPLSQDPIIEPSQPSPRKVSVPQRGGKVQAIKSKYAILELFKASYPQVALRGRGRFLSACCPFHKETEPSFWIDTERNLFGCHACKVAGDVINFYALTHGITNSEAIKRMGGAQ